MNELTSPKNAIPFDLGSYTAEDASRLLGLSARSVRRWIGGYRYSRDGESTRVPPLWISELSMIDDRLEIGFRDLIELRFVKAFTDAGVGLLAVRNCLKTARAYFEDERPFSNLRFRTDGRSIFLQTLRDSGQTELLDLRRQQYVFHQVVEQSFKDLDFEDATISRWRPFKGKSSIVVDPKRSFGRPIAEESGVPTATLAEAVEIEGSIERVSRLYDVPAKVVRDAVSFEQGLARK